MKIAVSKRGRVIARITKAVAKGRTTVALPKRARGRRVTFSLTARDRAGNYGRTRTTRAIRR